LTFDVISCERIRKTLAFGVRRSAFDVWRLAFGVWRLAFGVWRLALGVRYDSSHSELSLNITIKYYATDDD
jgi:hypothetical protein